MTNLQELTNSLSEEEEFELRRLYLQQIGITQEDTLNTIARILSLTQIQTIETAFSRVSNKIRNSVLAINPGLLVLDAKLDINTFVTELNDTIKLAAGFEGYEIFDINLYPEHFSYPTLLEQTRTALNLLINTRAEVQADAARETGTQDNALRSSPQPAHPEQALIDQLGQLFENKYLAYGIIRFGFHYRGTYPIASIPQGQREKLLTSVFERPPRIRDIRSTEKELIKYGFLVTDSAAKKSDNVLFLNAYRNIPNERTRELFIALTNNTTYPANAPRLPIK